MKAGSKATKVVQKKKISHYSRQECESELARLANDSSKYKDHIKERLASL